MLLAVAIVFLPAGGAGAFGPLVLFEPEGECSRPYCTTYAKSAQLPSGRLVATFEDNNQPVEDQAFPIFTSDDDGRTWERTSEVADTGPRQWTNWASPFLYVLPEPLGDMPAGTLLLAGVSSPPDHEATALQIYRSNDEAETWSWVSEVTLGGGEWGSSNPTPIWEPFLLMADGRLIVYYSDERDKADHDQKIVHQTSTDGVTWGPIVEDVAPADEALRPGMPVVTRMADGRYLMVYEVVGLEGTPNHFKISDDAENWRPLDLGTRIDSGGSPYVVTLPDGRLAYNSYGSTDIRVNAGSGTGAWTPVRTNMPRGYSRQLQYVEGTGRVLIFSVEGFWLDQRNTVYYGDVDLGYSAGPYYRLVNRNSGMVLDVSGGSIQDGAGTVQTTATGRASQRWHVTDTGDGYVNLLNQHSGRALAIGSSGTADGDRAIQWVENDLDDQDWVLVPAEGDYFKIVNRNSGKVLGVPGGSTAEGAEVVQWTDTGALDQQWQLMSDDTEQET